MSRTLQSPRRWIRSLSFSRKSSRSSRKLQQTSDYEHLDLASLCALALKNKSLDIPDEAFKRRLDEVCPWFEPQFSHRSSYRECALEYMRRQRRGAKFAKVTLASPKEYYCVTPEQRTPNSFVFDSRVQDVTLLGASALTPLRIDAESMEEYYTSEHGITLHLWKRDRDEAEKKAVKEVTEKYFSFKESSDMKDAKNFPNEEDQTVYAEIMSFPHVLVVMVMLHDPLYFYQNNNVFVKFKNTPGKEADWAGAEANCGYSVQVMGSHVFLIEHAMNRSGDRWFNINYLHNGEVHRVLRVSDIHASRPMCYDGLWQFFDYGEQKFRAYQTSLSSRKGPMDEVSVEDMISPTIADCLLYEGCSEHLMLQGIDTSSYHFNLKRGTLLDMQAAIDWSNEQMV